MRVIFLTHNYPRYSGDVAGGFLATLAKAIQARGHEIQVIAPSDEGNVGEPTLDDVAVRRVRYADPKQEVLAYRGAMTDAMRSPTGWLALIGMYRALRHAARDSLAHGADLVHAHWWVPGGLAAPAEGRLVLTVHGTDVRLLGRSGLLRTLARPVFDRARVVTTVSTAHALQVEASLGRRITAEHIQPMPADLAAFGAPGAGGDGAVLVARLTRRSVSDSPWRPSPSWQPGDAEFR